MHTSLKATLHIGDVLFEPRVILYLLVGVQKQVIAQQTHLARSKVPCHREYDLGPSCLG